MSKVKTRIGTRTVFIFITIVAVVFVYVFFNKSVDFPDFEKYYVNFKEMTKKIQVNDFYNFRNLSEEEINNLSVLGRRLFLHEDIGVPQNKTFLIYIYKDGPHISKRFIGHYSGQELDPFQNCSVRNCLITYNHSNFHLAHAVLFHLQKLPAPPHQLERRNYDQRWVWLSDEGIFGTFNIDRKRDLNYYTNFFNWSMTYRMDSDVPVPYGRTIPLLNHSRIDADFLDVFSRKRSTLAVMASHCNGNRNRRWTYVKELERHIKVDFYGKCGTLKCPGHFRADCPQLNAYKFYLAFENSNCKDYVTEKAWWNGFEKEAVPVVMGTNKANYRKLFPPNSFIHVEDFASPKDLAKYLRYLSENKDEYNKYHLWRSNFEVVNEHGYFQSNVYHYCRLCEALNYNSPLRKENYSMKAFWNVTRDCNTKRYW